MSESINSFNTKVEKLMQPSEILLHLVRHSKKEGGYTDDYAAPSSAEGIDLVNKKLPEYESDVPERQKLAHGSPRARAQETAILLSQIDQDQPASRLRSDERLNFHFDFEEDNEFARTMNASFKTDYLKKLVEESDVLAAKAGDEKNSTYSRMASNVAGFVDAYVRRSKRWNEAVNNTRETNPEAHKKDGGEYDPRLERFIGTHQGVVESFIAKLLENKYGKDRRDEFVSQLNNMGFELVEGIDIKIVEDKDGKKITLQSRPGSNFTLSEEVTEEEIKRLIEK